MQLKSLLVSALVASGAAAKRTCGAFAPTAEQKLIAQNFLLKETEAKEAGNVTATAISVNVYFHVVATSTSASGGYLPQSALDAQLKVLNQAYAPQGISFKQAGADWTVNTNWANDRSELQMKKQLRKGTYADLNAYFIKNSPYLGYSYFPGPVTTGSDDFYYDGVVCLSSTVPGGTAPYDLGHTLTHEAGHWFGLYHTFGDGDGSCTGDGDFVADTPFEASPAFGCDLSRDTCPRDPGNDPVTNYMDYSDDACFTGFTSGQEARMDSMWDAYRARFK